MASRRDHHYNAGATQSHGGGVPGGKNRKRKAPAASSSYVSTGPVNDTTVMGKNFDTWMMMSPVQDDIDTGVNKLAGFVTQPVPMEPYVEFSRGVKCTDAATALKILGTRFKLRNIAEERRKQAGINWMMTDAFSPKIAGAESNWGAKQNVYFAADQLKDMSTKIFEREIELKNTLMKILAAEEHQRHLEKDLLQPEPLWDEEETEDMELANEATPPNIDGSRSAVDATTDIPMNQINEAGPQTVHPITEQTEDGPPAVKKRRRNVFQRAARAIRKRLA